MKIIANGITNLTDARYFAAMGVDWMGFDMGQDSPLTITQVVAFADWVEGPEFFLDVRNRTVDQIAEMLGNFPAAGLLLDKQVSLPHFAGKRILSLAPDDTPTAALDRMQDTLIVDEEQWRQMGNTGIYDNADEIWLKIENVTQYQCLKAELYKLSGIVVSGGDEQKVGLKSYNDLDDLLNLIR